MIKIAAAKISDAQAIRRLENRVWGEEVVNKYDAAMFARFGWCFLARDGRRAVGAICSYPTKSGEVYVCDWVVDPAYRRRGLGQKLYKRLLQTVKGRPVVSLINPKNRPSLLVHKQLGFRTVRLVRNAYALKGGLESGARILVRLENKKMI